MLDTWEQRARREGITLTKISFPVPPPSMADLTQRLESSLGPRTKVLHFCHMTNLAVQVFPRTSAKIARARGIQAIVDGKRRPCSPRASTSMWSACIRPR